MKTLKHVTSRPYPKDKARSIRIKKAMLNCEIETIKDLANRIHFSYEQVIEVVNGTRQPTKTEKEIANFLGVDKDYLFPKRDKYTLQQQAIEQGLITEEEAIFKKEYKNIARLIEASGF